MAMGEEDGKMDYYYNRAIECLILLLLTLLIAVHQQKKTFEALIAQQKSFLDSYNTYMKEMHESLRHNSSQTEYIPRELIELLRNDREQNRTHIQRARFVQVGQTNNIVNNSAEPSFPTDFSSTNTREDNSRDDISSVPSHSSHQSAPTLDERPFSAPPTAHSEHQVPDDQLVPNYISSTSTYSMSDPGNKEDEFEPSTAKDLEYMNTYINAKPDKSFKNSVSSHSSNQSVSTLDERPFSAPPTAHSEHQVPDDQLVPNYISSREDNSRDDISSVPSHSSHQSVSTLDERPFSAPPTAHSEHQVPDDQLVPNYISSREDNSRDDISSVPSHSSHQSVSTLDERPFSAPPTAHSEHQVPDDQLVPNYISSTSTYSMSDSGNKEDEFEPSTAKDLEYMNTYINAKPDKSFKNSTYDTLDRDHWTSIDSADEVYEPMSYYQIWNEDKIFYLNNKPSRSKRKKINWWKVKGRVQRFFKGKDRMEYDSVYEVIRA